MLAAPEEVVLPLCRALLILHVIGVSATHQKASMPIMTIICARSIKEIKPLSRQPYNVHSFLTSVGLASLTEMLEVDYQEMQS